MTALLVHRLAVLARTAHPLCCEQAGATGRAIYAVVTHIVGPGEYGVPPGLVVMSIRPWHHEDHHCPVSAAAGQVSHDLKTDPYPFEAVWRGLKTCEVRSGDDRAFAVGQVLLLREHVR